MGLTIIGLAVVALALLAMRQASRGSGDQDIDDRIAQNRYRYRKGMRKPDYAHIHAIGNRRWSEAAAAQQRVDKVTVIRKRA